MTDLMPMVHEERRSLAAFLDTIGPEQWQASTWCDKWTVQDLVGHLTAAGNITAPHFFGGFIRCRFNFDRFVEGDLRSYAEGTPAEVRRRFDAIIDSNCKPPGPAYVALGEIMVHGEDIRRPLGGRGDHPPDHLTTLAELYKKTGAPLPRQEAVGGPPTRGHRRRVVDRRGTRRWARGAGSLHVSDPGHGRPGRRLGRLRGTRGRNAPFAALTTNSTGHDARYRPGATRRCG